MVHGSARLAKGFVRRASEWCIRILIAVRAGEWWDFKLVPILMLFYASAVHLDVPMYSLWPELVMLFGALVPGAIYVSLVNDLTDIADDRAAGKFIRVAEGSRIRVIGGISACLAAGLSFAVVWRHDPLLLSIYGGAWLAFTLYSVPPFRLKARGFAGLVADSAGSNLFPGMLAALLAMRGATAVQDLLWLACVGCWAFAYGLRGILWHQLGDADADKAAGVATYVQRYGPHSAAILGKWVALPVELGAMSLLLWQMEAISALPALVIYACLVLARRGLFKQRATLLEPKQRAVFLPQEYYDLFLPLALLVGSTVRYPADIWVLVAHLVLFPRRSVQFLIEVAKLYRASRSR